MRLPLALPILSLLAVAGVARAADAQDDAARAQVARCAAEAKANTTGLEALERACPGLGAALDRLRLAPALAEGTREKLDAPSLERLLNATRPAARPGPDPARLAGVMQGLRTASESPSMWQRFKRWVENTFLARRDAGSSPWLSSWLEKLTPGALLRDVLVWGLVIGVVGAAVFVIVRELRASDVRWATALRRRARDGSPLVHDAAVPGEDWRRLAAAEQPAALFRHVALRLGAEGRLPALGSHTHRELRDRAKLELEEERAAWQALARAAERQIYAPRDADEAAGRAVAQAARVWSPPP